MSYTIGGVSLGNVQKITARYHSKATIESMPDADRTNTYACDYDGVVLYLTVEGILKDDTPANLRTMISNLRALHTGTQYTTTSLSFQDDFMSESIYVLFESFEYIADISSPSSVRYVATFVQRPSAQEG